MIECILESILKEEPIVVKIQGSDPSEKMKIANELLARLAGVDIHAIRTGTIKKEEWPKITRAAAKLSEANVYFSEDDEPILDPNIQKVIEYKPS